MAKIELLGADELRKRLLGSAESAFASRAREIVGDACEMTWSSAYESPIEQVFAKAWWIASALVHGWPVRAELLPQHDVSSQGHKYRCDFVVTFIPPYALHVESAEYQAWQAVAWPKIAIELDGHDFHERTKEQVAHRNARDRDLQLDGWTVLHFSGTEITRDPVGVALAVTSDAHRRGEHALYRSLVPQYTWGASS